MRGGLRLMVGVIAACALIPSGLQDGRLPHASAQTSCDNGGWIQLGRPHPDAAPKDLAVRDTNAVSIVGYGDYSSWIHRWNGSSWAAESFRTPPNSISLQQIDFGPVSGRFVVGRTSELAPVALRWTPNGWARIDPPDTWWRIEYLSAVSAVSRTSAWAVGTVSHRFPDGKWRMRGAIKHWNGRRWINVTLDRTAELYGVHAVSNNDVWAVGYSGGLYGKKGQTLILHYDGQSWRRTPTPATKFASALNAIFVAGRQKWAVGWRFNIDGDRLPLVLRRRRGEWVKVSTPSVDVMRTYGGVELTGVSFQGGEVAVVGDGWIRNRKNGVVWTRRHGEWTWHPLTDQWQLKEEAMSVEHSPTGDLFVLGQALFDEDGDGVGEYGDSLLLRPAACR